MSFMTRPPEEATPGQRRWGAALLVIFILIIAALSGGDRPGETGRQEAIHGSPQLLDQGSR